MQTSIPAPTEPARIIDWWRATAGREPQRLAVIDNGEEWSFARLDARSAELARGLLAQGAGKGSRVGILFPNRAEWFTAWLAITRIGGIAVTLSTFFAPPEIAYTLRHADVAWLLCAREYLGHSYDDRLTAALPGLAGSSGKAPLALTEAPCLRGIWFDGAAPAPWAAGSLDDLAASAEGCAHASTAMLGAIEETVAPADRAMLLYTSGSTAAPKGVVHTQASIARKIEMMVQMNSIIPFETSRDDRLLVNSPMFWVGGFLTATGAMALGAVSVFEDDHSPATMLRALRERGVTSVTGGEGVLRSIQEAEGFNDADLVRMRPQNSAQLNFFNRFGKTQYTRVTNSLGMTETFGPHSGDQFQLLDPEIGRTSCGFALDGTEYRIVDPETGAILPTGEAGELRVRSLWLMDGFYKRERRDVFDADGFYPTGDICKLMPDGRLDFQARHGGMIKTSGANVSAEEVELTLFAHPEIVEAAVFGLPDRQRDEIVVAVVATRAGSRLDEPAVKLWVKERLSAFKVPRRVVFRAAEDLPRTPSQKIRKPLLAEQVREEI